MPLSPSAVPAWLIYALASAVCAALVAIFGKIGTQHLDPTLATALRSVIMALFCLGAVTVMRLWPKTAHLDMKATLAIAAAGVAGALSWLFYFKAIQLGEVAKVMPLDKLSVPIGILLAFVLLHERPSALNWVGAGVLTVGAILAAWK